MLVSVLVRRLKKGKTYEDFRAAWASDDRYGAPVKVINARSLDDPDEVVSIGLMDIDTDELAELLGRVADQERARHDRIAEIIEETRLTGFYEVQDVDDLT
ncbi:MAG: hypothetical protein R2726_06700 [Acidimicrobiales bacterium]